MANKDGPWSLAPPELDAEDEPTPVQSVPCGAGYVAASSDPPEVAQVAEEMRIEVNKLVERSAQMIKEAVQSFGRFDFVLDSFGPVLNKLFD